MEKAQQQAAMEICGPEGLDLGPVTYKCNGREVTSKGFRKGPKNLRQTVLEAVEKHADKEFLVYNDLRFTFKQTKEKALRMCSLLKDLGIKRGDVVAIAAKNSDKWSDVYMGCMIYGAICVPMNAFLKGDDFQYVLNNSGTVLVFCDGSRFDKILPLRSLETNPFKGKIVVFDPENSKKEAKFEDGIFKYEEVMSKAEMMKNEDLPEEREKDDTYAIMYTSGTTGFPKGVIQTNENVNQAMSCVKMVMYIMGAMKKAANIPIDPKAQEVIMCPAPLFHVTALHATLLASLVMGRKVVLMNRWSVTTALQTIENEKVTFLVGVPTMIQDVMEHPNFSKTDTSSLKTIFLGGAPTPSVQVPKMKKNFGESSVQGSGYGLTETINSVCVIHGADYVKKPSSVGKAQVNCEVMVIHSDLATEGKYVELEKEKVGEIVVRSPAVMVGYHNLPEKTDEAIVEVEGKGYGWFRTGDIGKIDSEGFVFLLDRAKDIIIRGGENISCVEVESALHNHSDVRECAVYGIKDERLGEVVGATICLNEGTESFNKVKDKCTAEEEEKIKKAILSKVGDIASYKIPEMRFLDLTVEILPRGDTGKILKRKLRDAANEKLTSPEVKETAKEVKEEAPKEEAPKEEAPKEEDKKIQPEAPKKNKKCIII